MPEQNVPTATEQAAATEQAPASSEGVSKPSLGRVIAAWAVHAFTISGLAWATLALFAMLENNIPMMWLWFAIALIVDGVDGTLARKVGVRQVIPWFDGGVVDNLVDYLTWTFLPALFMAPFSVFFLRQFFLSLPREIEEAAMLDGLGPIARFFRVTIPMSTGPIMTMALITIIGMWKDFLWPLLVGRNGAQLLTVALGIFQQQSPNRAPDWTGLMAGSTLSVVPVLILLVLMGRKLVESLNFSGIK